MQNMDRQGKIFNNHNPKNKEYYRKQRSRRRRVYAIYRSFAINKTQGKVKMIHNDNLENIKNRTKQRSHGSSRPF